MTAEQADMTAAPQPMRNRSHPRVPFVVPFVNPIVRALMRLGVPFGPNALLTVRGRKSGTPRTTPVAMVEIGGRNWVIGTFGQVNWVRNLRAAGEGVVGVGRHRERMLTTELSREETERFFADVLGPYVRRLRLGPWLLGSVLRAGIILDDPHAAAQQISVFELRKPA